MDLLDQFDLIKSQWRTLIETTRGAGIPSHISLEALTAEIATTLAEQP